MDKFGIKKALQEIANGNIIKMESEDFKTHLFHKSKLDHSKPIVHTIRKSVGNLIDLYLTFEEMKEKFGQNKFYLYEM